MKRILLLIAFGAILASCGRGKVKDQAIADLSSKSDSLQFVVEKRDSIINDALLTISDIASSLDEVKRQEGIVVSQVEVGKTSKDQITEDLQVISALLSKNRKRIASLERSTSQLKDANIRIDGLTKLVNQLTAQIKEKDATINSMLENITGLKQQVSELNSTVATLSDEKQQLKEEVTQKTTDLNLAYYIVGQEKTLVDQGVLIKKGAIGRTLIVNPNLDKHKLTKIDIRSVDRIDIKGSKAEVIGSFSPSAYTLEEGEGKRVIDAIVITDKDQFWKNSRVLVISYK